MIEMYSKNVLIMAHEGTVYIENLPRNFKRDWALNIAMNELTGKHGRLIGSLANVDYIVNPHIIDEGDYWGQYRWAGDGELKHSKIHTVPLGAVTVDYNDIKEEYSYLKR